MGQSIAPIIPLNLAKPSAPLEVAVLANIDLSPDSPEDNRHIVLSLGDSGFHYVEGQSVGVVPPGVDTQGKPYRLRLYSIASAREGDDGAGKTLSLCVKRVAYEHPETGEPVRGVCSNFLNDLVPGDTVKLIGPVGKHFLLPADPAAHLLMIATGTGLAPFRGFLRHRNTLPPAGRGRAVLVFGARTTSDILYREDLEQGLSGEGDRLSLALSREQQTPDGRRMYVGDRLAELSDELWPLLVSGSLYVFICGLKGMETGIEGAFKAVADKVGADWVALRADLVKQKRWLVETY